jgi:hypothetical protein
MSRRRKIVLPVIIALLAITGSYLAYFQRPALRRMRRDRRLVEECTLDASVATEARPFVEPSDCIYLSLGNGDVKCVGKDVLFCSRSMSHHNRYWKFRGYIYVKVNGRLFYNSTGPCDGAVLRIPVHKTSDVDMSLFLAILKADGYVEIN